MSCADKIQHGGWGGWSLKRNRSADGGESFSCRPSSSRLDCRTACHSNCSKTSIRGSRKSSDLAWRLRRGILEQNVTDHLPSCDIDTSKRVIWVQIRGRHWAIRLTRVDL